MADDKPQLITHEDYGSRNLSQADREFLGSVTDTSQHIQIKSAEELMEMAKAAKAAYDRFEKDIRKYMTKKRAEEVYDFRVTKNYSWRLLAVACWTLWGDSLWNPPTNQLAGMALCKVAGEVLKKEIP